MLPATAPPRSPAPPSRDRLDGAEALILVVVAFTLLFTVGGAITRRLGPAGLAVTELSTVALPTVGWLLLRRVRLATGLALGRPTVGVPRALAAGALLGLGGFYLVAALVEAGQERVLPLPPGLKTALRELLVPPSGARPLAVDLATLALLPALCEEALFRGALLEALRPAGAVPAVAGSALLFAFYHGSLYRLLPMFALGLLLGAAAWRARSILPTVLLHVVNNALVVLLLRLGRDEPPPLLAPVGAALTLLSIGLVAVGLRLLAPRADRPARS